MESGLGSISVHANMPKHNDIVLVLIWLNHKKMKREIKFSSSWYSIKISVELKEKKEWQEVLSIMGTVYKEGILIAWGQCYNTIDSILNQEEENLKEWEKIKYWWVNYHLNDMHPWTEKQEEALMGKNYDYSKACEYLKSIGLFEDNGYKYWCSRLYRPIPEKDLDEIKSFIIA